MEFIRGWKQSNDYDINETHCIYGNDSDLILLSLALHLPNIIILREEMKFTKENKNSGTKRLVSTTKMEILFINLLREYFDLECNDYKKDF